MKVDRFLLESAAARGYLIDSLQGGDALSAALLELPLKSEGYLSAFVPSECKRPLEDLDEFYRSLDVGRVPSQIAIEEFVGAYLKTTETAMALFSTLALEGDGAIQSFKTAHVFTDPPDWWGTQRRRKGVLLVLEGKQAGVAAISSACHETSGTPERIALMIPPSHDPLGSGTHLDTDSLRSLTRFTDHIVAGAFDEESILIWSRLRPDIEVWPGAD